MEFSAGLAAQAIPEQIGGWERVKDLTIPASAYEALAPDALIMRQYRNGEGRPLSLTIVYHENARWGAHNPQVCYRSQGWHISNSVKRRVRRLVNNDFEINQFTVTKDGQSQLISYWWYTSGKRQMASRLEHMFYMCLNGVIHGHIESGFVSLSTPVFHYADESSQRIVDDFCKEFVPILASVID